ncbi:hypothetical protein O163_11490 [Caldanaerobacter subterraneus subsp. yonseiensis KB-1]|uniref:Uncharacterized protein n=1 Tax=Caldanaerobacter subterraneus subsp. yonseiensis KB-1 TaxID=1388761 RepID=U5CML2_CALSX|nr:hypothetical protein O163_11490 [Caldanaerobacter subterraneus subsp. yonseiensis KB-1]
MIMEIAKKLTFVTKWLMSVDVLANKNFMVGW